MSRKISYLLGIVLTIIIGTFLYLKFCCSCCTDAVKSNQEYPVTVAPKPDSDSITEPVSDSVTVSTTTEWVVLKEKINANPLILFFNTAKSNDITADDEKQKIDDLINYSKNVPDATFIVIGHSDNVGSSASNVTLGKNRAEFTKTYLVEKGLDLNRISTSSKGPDEPMADNNTPEGRAKNRRAVITIQ